MLDFSFQESTASYKSFAPVSVSDLNLQIKELLEYEFSFVHLMGEVTNCKLHAASGNFYFSLKDEGSQISAVLWKTRMNAMPFNPENGMKVVVKGKVSVFKARGTYQIDVFEMKPLGRGDLQMAFEMLKAKLFAEGLFDAESKRPIPSHPQKIGIVTSESGAVIEDFKNVARKRYPLAEIYLFPALMQGSGSIQSVCSAIEHANNCDIKIDVLVIARGGGSMEDLWTFNSEQVARAVSESVIPVVSAIGHEIDFTICDFAADMRAPTPSAAAEHILPDKNELTGTLDFIQGNLNSIVRTKLDCVRQELDAIERSYALNKPADLLENAKAKLRDSELILKSVVLNKLLRVKENLLQTEKLLFNIGPDQTLKRGYAVVEKDGKPVSNDKTLESGDDVRIIFYEGSKEAKIK